MIMSLCSEMLWLFKNLVRRDLPNIIVCILYVWFFRQCFKMKWDQRYLSPFMQQTV